jgi:hypothetical protein
MNLTPIRAVNVLKIGSLSGLSEAISLGFNLRG